MSCRTEKPKAAPKQVADKHQVRLINQGQKKLAGRIHEDITKSMAGLENSIKEAEGGSYDQELPPSLLPKCRIALASMKESRAVVELLLSEGWRGDAKTSLEEVQTVHKLAKDVQARLEAIIEENKPPA